MPSRDRPRVRRPQRQSADPRKSSRASRSERSSASVAMRKSSRATARRSASSGGAARRENSRSSKPAHKIRYAVIGLGHLAQSAVLPAFGHARHNSTLAALVSGDPQKLKQLGRRYGVELLCHYDDSDTLFSSGAIDAVYISLPNSMHAQFARRAAAAGLHVLCEKPMAVSSRDCERMIETARRNHVKLMIAYRLHFEPGNLEAMQLAQSGKLGDLRFFTSTFSMQVAPDNIRTKRELGGGPLYDIGIYCINAARTLFASEPIDVVATATSHSDPRFKEVPETVMAVMRFPQKQVASFTCSFGASARSSYEIVGTTGSITGERAYSEGIAFTQRMGNRVRVRRYRKSDQFAPELIHFSDCLLHDREPEPTGEEGLADVRVIEALNDSIVTGKWVSLEPRAHKGRTDKRQAMTRPAPRPADLIGVSAPQLPQ